MDTRNLKLLKILRNDLNVTLNTIDELISQNLVNEKEVDMFINECGGFDVTVVNNAVSFNSKLLTLLLDKANIK